MLPAHCGEWEYKDHPDYAVLPGRCDSLKGEAYINPSLVDRYIADTRPAHLRLFEGLTNPGEDIFAGHYRGDPGHECLEPRPVFIGPHEGTKPEDVDAAMQLYHSDFQDAITVLIEQRPSKVKLSDDQWLALISEVFANLLERLFTIHPYANGNGHIGRLIILLGLIKIQRYPARWSLDDRPAYSDAVQKHREGDKDDLQKFFLSAIKG